MQQTLTLSPAEKGNHTIKFTGEYYDKKHKLQVYLLTNGEVVTNRKLTDNEKVFTQQFGDKIKNWVFKYDDENKKEVFWAEKLKRHELVACDGNDNLLRAFFEVIDTRKEESKKVLANKLMLMVGNMVGRMKVTQMRDIAYFKGENVSRMTGEQIYLKLCSIVPGNPLGILMNDPQGSIDSFQSPDREIITVVQKAIALEVIKLSGGMYYIGQELAGKDAAAITVYCKSNKQLYESFVKREVELHDTLPIDMTEDMTVQELLEAEPKKEFKHKDAIKTPEQNAESLATHQRKVHDEEMARQNDIAALRLEAKALSVKGWQVPAITRETLVRKIAEAKALSKETAVA